MTKRRTRGRVARSSAPDRRKSKAGRAASPLVPLIGLSDGSVTDLPGLVPLARTGNEFRPPRDEELVLLPKDSELQFLPDRNALSRTGEGELLALEGSAVAVRLPAGYTRTLLPAYQKLEDARDRYLPFFGYTAVFARGDDLVCAAVRTEESSTWRPQSYHHDNLPADIEALKSKFPGNRILQQLQTCALEYGCYNAQNVFHHRWEGAVTVSPACNAQCLGCISLQPEDLPPSPQERFVFKPTLKEIMELGAYHLKAPRAIFSFGQGCEGEPLLAGDLISEAVAKLSPLADRGTIHLNTNASLPKQVKKIVDAGLDSMRVSTNSCVPQSYETYYQPKRYSFEALRESIRIARRAEVFVSLNLLMMPGWIDAEDEFEALVRFVQDEDVQMIQLRTLNIDPDLYARHVPVPKTQPLGIPKFLTELRKLCPNLILGNHSPQVRKGEDLISTNRAPRVL